MWKVQTKERAPFWFKLLVFKRADGQCFVPPIIVHQSKEYSQGLHLNNQLKCIVHHPPYGYMDRYGWLKSITQLSTICGASSINNQTIFFDGHGSHFYDRILSYMGGRYIQPFLLNQGGSGNKQPNDNGINEKLK